MAAKVWTNFEDSVLNNGHHFKARMLAARAVTGASYAPNHTVDDLAPLAMDRATGRLMVNVDAALTANTQYQEGATVAAPYGTVLFGQDSSDVVHAALMDVNGKQYVLQGDLDYTVDDVTAILSDGTNAIKVTNTTPGAADYALVTRNIPSGTQTISGTVAITNANLDVALSTVAQQATLALIKAKTDNLDVALSTVAQQATLALIKAKTDNLDTALSAYVRSEDSASANTDKGIGIFAIRKATPANLSDTDADYEFLQMSAGRLWTSGFALGDVAHGATDSGNPLKIGGYAATVLPSAVTDGQRVNALFTKSGKMVGAHTLPENKLAQNTTITSSTAETTIVTGDATYKLSLYGLVLSNTSTTYTKVTVKDATLGTTRFVISCPPQDTRGYMLPACDGHKQSAANNNWTLACTTSVASLEITALAEQAL